MRVITRGRARLRVSGSSIDWRELHKYADQYHHDLRQVADIEAYKDDMRVQEIEQLLLKAAKFRKPVVRTDGRTYPRFGQHLSTHDYVRDYYAANPHNGMSAADGFEPLSTRITPVEGEYLEEIESCATS